MDKRIFISYSSKDVTIANQLVEYLEANNCPCWIAPRNITSGHDYTDMINDAINECRGVVLIMSSHSVKSQWVKKELSTAVSYNKTIIPFKITDVTLTGGLQFLLNNVQWIDATSNTTKMFPQVIKGLGGEDVSTAIPIDDHPSGGKKSLWIILAAVVTVAAVAVILLVSSGSEPEPEALPAKPDTVVIHKVIDTVIVEQPTKAASTTKEATANKRTETAKTKEKHTEKVEAVATQPVEETKSETKQVVSAASAPEVVVPQPKPVVIPEEQPTATVDPITPPPQKTTSPKMRNARNLWKSKKYKEALALFLELKKADPTNKELDTYISDCRSHL